MEQRGTRVLKHGAWHVRFYADGKQKSKRLCDGDLPEKRVEIEFRKFMEKINGPGHNSSPSKDRTVASFFNWTYYRFIKRNWKHSTVVGYKSVWKKHLKGAFGKKLLKEITTPDASLFLTKLARTKRPRTVTHIKWLASAIFMHAVNTRHVATNVWRDAQVLGKHALQDQQTGSYTLEEIENIITLLVDHVECQLILCLAFFAGLRRSEIGALQWGDIDSDFIHVRRAVVRGVVGTPKTLKSVRRLPIIEPVRTALNAYRRKGCDGYLFKGRDKNVPADINHFVRSVIEPTLLKNNIEWRGLHACRRGLGTTLRALTGNSNAGKDILGHTTTAVTEKHYEHEMPAEALAGMKMLEAKVVESK